MYRIILQVIIIICAQHTHKGYNMDIFNIYQWDIIRADFPEIEFAIKTTYTAFQNRQTSMSCVYTIIYRTPWHIIYTIYRHTVIEESIKKK